MREFGIIIFLLLISMPILQAQQAMQESNKQEVNMIFNRLSLLGIDTDNQSLLYGYFFYGKNDAKLKKLAKKLSKDSYQLVRIEKVDETKSMLHLEKIDKLNAESFIKTEDRLKQMASKYAIEYDGFDVGNENPEEPLITPPSVLAYQKDLGNEQLYRNAIRLYNLREYRYCLKGFELCLERGIKVDTSTFKLANSIINLGAPREGISLLKKLVESYPRYENALFNIAATSYRIDELDDAKTYYLQVLKVNPMNDGAQYGVGSVLYIEGKIVQALAYCNEALRINPDNENAQILLNMIQENE